jgi:deazaflavin-dependent oxidoreductase (nitroreductase family)
MNVAERSHNPFLRSATGGRILSALMLPRFMLRPPAGFGVLTTTGRKTGKVRRKCIRAVRDGDRVYIVSIRSSAWLMNARANPHVRVRIRGGAFAAVAREPRDAGERRRAMEAYCGTVHRFDYMECLMWRRGRPTRAKIDELHRGWFREGTPLVLELDEKES